MADTVFAAGDALAVQVWAKKLFVESLKATQLDKFIGTGSDSVIQVRDELNKGPGDKLFYGLRMQLDGAGIAGDSTLEGQEEALVTHRDEIGINQLRHAVKVVGNMSQQRVTFDIRAEAQAGLVDWWAQRLDTSLINQLAGNDNPVNTNLIYSGLNAILPPSVTRATGNKNFDSGSYAILPEDLDSTFGADTVNSAEAILSSDADDGATEAAKFAFNLRMLDKAVIKARTLPTPIRPIKLNGMECYVAFLHPYQVYDLRRNTQTGQWMDIQKAALSGGQITKNPIFTGAVGMYSGVIIHEDARVPYGTSTDINGSHHTHLGSGAVGVARGIFCGAQAGAIAFGRAYGYSGSNIKFKWTEVLDDYENQLGVSSALVYGMKKTRFNSKDFGTITMSSYSPGTGGTIAS